MLLTNKELIGMQFLNDRSLGCAAVMPVAFQTTHVNVRYWNIGQQINKYISTDGSFWNYFALKKIMLLTPEKILTIW